MCRSIEDYLRSLSETSRDVGKIKFNPVLVTSFPIGRKFSKEHSFLIVQTENNYQSQTMKVTLPSKCDRRNYQFDDYITTLQ